MCGLGKGERSCFPCPSPLPGSPEQAEGKRGDHAEPANGRLQHRQEVPSICPSVYLSITRAICSLPSRGRLQRRPARGWPAQSGCPTCCAPLSGVPAEGDRKQPGLGRLEGAQPGEQHPGCSWGHFSLLLPPPLSVLGGEHRAGHPVCLAGCSLLPAPCLLCPRSWQPGITQHPLPSLRDGGTGGILLTIPCIAQYLLRPHVGLHPARMDGHAQDALVSEPCTLSPCSGQPRRGTAVPA